MPNLKPNMEVQVNKIISRKTLVSEEVGYVLGVCNVIFSVALLAKYPWRYWVWHCIKNAILMLYRLVTWRKIKWHYFLWEYCYVVNYFTILYFTICVWKTYYPIQPDTDTASWGYYLHMFDHMGPDLFRVAYAFAMGPLALSVFAFRNGLVFHSITQLTILAVHIGPAAAIFGMRWYAAELEAEFPDTFHIGVSTETSSSTWIDQALEPDLLSAMVTRPIIYYFTLWAIPYSMVIFKFRANRIKERGYSTMYSVYEKAMDKYLNVLGVAYRPVVYMGMHALLSCLSFMITPFLWSSFYGNSIYLLILLLISIYNAATYYFHVFAGKYWRSGRRAAIVELQELLRKNSADNEAVVIKEYAELPRHKVVAESKEALKVVETINMDGEILASGLAEEDLDALEEWVGENVSSPEAASAAGKTQK